MCQAFISLCPVHWTSYWHDTLIKSARNLNSISCCRAPLRREIFYGSWWLQIGNLIFTMRRFVLWVFNLVSRCSLAFNFPGVDFNVRHAMVFWLRFWNILEYFMLQFFFEWGIVTASFHLCDMTGFPQALLLSLAGHLHANLWRGTETWKMSFSALDMPHLARSLPPHAFHLFPVKLILNLSKERFTLVIDYKNSFFIFRKIFLLMYE